jgi:hypothetical protein
LLPLLIERSQFDSHIQSATYSSDRILGDIFWRGAGNGNAKYSIAPNRLGDFGGDMLS